MPKISILTTLYRSELFVKDFYDKTIDSLNNITDDYEIIFVDDGSPDQSSLQVIELKKKDSKITLIELSRNFGQLQAIMCGLKYCTGDYIFLLDSDLEEDPGLLSLFYKTLNDNKLDFVYGQTIERRKLFIQGFLSSIFYTVFNLLADINIPKNITMMAMMNKKYLTSLLQFTEVHLFLAGLYQLNGFKQKGLFIEKSYKGFSSYSLVARFTMAIDAIFSFSSRPLYYISFMGMFISVSSVILSLVLIFRKFLLDEVLSGWTSLMIAILFLSGLIITSLGIIGIYIGKIFIQTKNRPNVIIRSIY